MRLALKIEERLKDPESHGAATHRPKLCQKSLEMLAKAGRNTHSPMAGSFRNMPEDNKKRADVFQNFLRTTEGHIKKVNDHK
jgi:hypothetical protein